MPPIRRRQTIAIPCSPAGSANLNGCARFLLWMNSGWKRAGCRSLTGPRIITDRTLPTATCHSKTCEIFETFYGKNSGILIDIMNYAQNVLGLVGRTPLVKLNRITHGLKATVLAKMENLNPGYSVKDRIGVAMIEAAEREGALKPGGTIVEATSGNTGIGLALAAAVKGYKSIFVMTDKSATEKVRYLKALGADVVVTPASAKPGTPDHYVTTAQRIASETPNSFYPDQYSHPANPMAHYLTTGPEIWEDTEGKITHF